MRGMLDIMKTEWFTNFSRMILYMMAGVMLLWLNISSISCPGFVAVLIALAVSVLLGLCLDKLCSGKKQWEWITLGTCCVLFGGICVWWVSNVPYRMEGDQAIVWQAAASALENNFIMYSFGGQMFIYPQQQGLAFLYEMLFRLTGSNSPQMIGYVNASLAPLTLFFGYQCVKESGGTSAALRFLPLMMLCLPYIIYSPYVYGDIPSICYTFIMLWSVLRFVKTMRYRYGIVACAVAMLALLSRKNIWIFFIGMLIGMFYHAISNKSVKTVIVAICIVLCASLSMAGIKQFNSMRSGYPVASGMPTILWVAMGVQYSEYGAGYYNNYSKEVYNDSDFNNELAAAIGLQEVKDRIKIFLEYPDQCVMFFEEKMDSQWVNPLFESIKFTGTMDEEAFEKAPLIVQDVYRGAGKDKVKQVCSMMMSVIYFFSFAGIVFRYFKKKPIVEDIPLIVFVGGFLFSIIWEAKARYVFPYFVLLHIYAAYGLTDISEVLKVKLATLLKK